MHEKDIDPYMPDNSAWSPDIWSIVAVVAVLILIALGLTW